MSMSPIWLQTTGLVDKEIWETNENLAEDIRIVSMLDILPRLAYYISVDYWRLNILEKNITDSKEIVSLWWKHRYFILEFFSFQNNLLYFFFFFYQIRIRECNNGLGGNSIVSK